MKGDLSAIGKMYMENLASPYDMNPNGGNALTYGFSQSNPEVVLFFLDHGVDYDHANQLGRLLSEHIWDHALGGRYGPHRMQVVRRMLYGEDYVEHFDFSTLYKIILGFMYKDFKATFDTSTDCSILGSCSR